MYFKEELNRGSVNLINNPMGKTIVPGSIR